MGNNRRILIATGIYKPDYRGPATLLEALPGALRAAGFEVKILTYSDVGGSSEEQLQDGVWRVSRKQGAILRFVKYFWLMKRLSKWSDVMYVTDTYSVGYFAYLLKKVYGKKYIIRFAGDSAWEKAAACGWTRDYIVDFQNKTYDQRIEKLKRRRQKIMLGADKIIAVSNFMANLAKQIGIDGNKIKVVYNSIDFGGVSGDDLSAAANIKNHYGREAKIILTSCQLVPWKGVAGIIKILPALKEKVGQINFLVLGKGQELNNLQALAKELGVSSSVFFLGKIERKQISSYFSAADLFVLNTNYEGLSHTLLEVMRARVSIVTTKIGGNPEVIEDGKEGFLVEYNNSEQLLEASAKILNDKDLTDFFIQNALEKLKKFSWEQTVQETTLILNEVCQVVKIR